MKFTKMQGAGNDYVYVNGFDEDVPAPAEIARQISDRHFGVGADGLILVLPSNTADVRMRIFNADGSEAEMCGNGIRCLAKFAFEHGLSGANPMRVETAAGLRNVELFLEDEKVTSARVRMGLPRLSPADIPVNIDGERVCEHPITVAGMDLRMTCVNMGNPHAVIFTDDVEAFPLEEVGPALENDALFPERVNVHVAQAVGPEEARMRTWERGSGLTLACGTGASAVCVAGVLTERTGRRVLIQVPGGALELEWPNDDSPVFLTGPCEEVFTGHWPEQ
ncbi:MAG: diaminopimelate epimerase [Planctomycetia bacterium]|nr:diaminopimelate epimerase [Planctomycetia bacterium]